MAHRNRQNLYGELQCVSSVASCMCPLWRVAVCELCGELQYALRLTGRQMGDITALERQMGDITACRY